MVKMCWHLFSLWQLLPLYHEDWCCKSLGYTSYTIYLIVELLHLYINLNIDIDNPQYALYGTQCAIHILSILSSVKSLELSNDTFELCLIILSSVNGHSSKEIKIHKLEVLKIPKLEVLKIPKGVYLKSCFSAINCHVSG